MLAKEKQKQTVRSKIRNKTTHHQQHECYKALTVSAFL